MSERVLVIGGSVRAAAFSAMRAGFMPVAGDRFADTDLQERCSATRIRDFSRGFVDLFRTAPAAPWFYTGGLENHPHLVARLAVERTLYGNPPATLRAVRDPWRLAAALADQGLWSPPLRRTGDQVARDGTWLCKARRSTGGAGVEVWGRRITRACWPRTACYFQRRMAGRPVAAVFVAARRRSVLLGITGQLIGVRWTGASGFRYCGTVGPLRPVAPVAAVFRRLGAVLADRFNLTGLFGVDAVVCGPRVWPVEVNPRYTASVEVLERALDLAAVAVHVRACRDGRLPAAPDWRRAAWHGKAILFARRAGRIGPGFSEWARNESGAGLWPEVADIPVRGTPLRPGAPVATAFAAGQNDVEVIRRLQARVADMARRLES